MTFDQRFGLFYDTFCKNKRARHDIRDKPLDYGTMKQSKETIMSGSDVHCECGFSFSEEKNEPFRCPNCGRSLSDRKKGQDSPTKNLSDSTIEATFEVMAEEGAIWSGAR